MFKKKIFIAIDTNKVLKAKKIIRDIQSNKTNKIVMFNIILGVQNCIIITFGFDYDIYYMIRPLIL